MHALKSTHLCSHPHVLLLQEIPMNFVDPKEYDIPGLVRKNRYKTILPSEYSLPQGVGAGSPSPGSHFTLRKALTPEWTSTVTRRGDGGCKYPGKGNTPFRG